MFPGITLFLWNTKEYNPSSYVSFKIIPMCIYILLAANLKVLKTFLEAILWQPFQLLHCISNGVGSITKAPSLQCWYPWREQVKLSWRRVRRVRRLVPVLSRLSLLRNPWPKPTGVLEYCREEETSCWLSIFSGRFLLTVTLKWWRMSMYISLFTVSVLVDYTSEFLKITPANSGNFLKILRISWAMLHLVMCAQDLCLKYR
jgi:hypothetical protein